MAIELSGEWDNFLNDSQTVDWRFNYQDEPWRCQANETNENQINKEEENHFYQKENCPSGANFFASLSRPIFVDEESIDKDKNVAWRFNFGDNGFRQRALTVPSCVHVKELEIHEYHKKNAKYEQKNYVMTKRPAPILKPVDCMTDTCEPCKPPCKLRPPCCPCLPPPPPPSCCIPYPNALTEKEWHNIRKEIGTMSESSDVNENALYERNVKTCDPCMLPQTGNKGRFYKRPEVETQNTMNPENPGKTKEDIGECSKRETRGPGIYPFKGFLPTAPLCMPGNIPCGYHFNERQAHTFCTSSGGSGGEDAPKPKPRPPPRPPPCPPKIKCPNPMPPYYRCPPIIACCSPCCGPC